MQIAEIEVETFEPVIGEKYEFGNSANCQITWSRPLCYVSKVPPPCINGQYKYLAYDDSIGGCSSSIKWFEFIRKPIDSSQPIPYESVLETIKKGDIIHIRLYGEYLRLVVSGSPQSLHGNLVNGSWGVNITNAYNTIKYGDFKIEGVNDRTVLPPKS